jgi:hypothetical protein
MLGGDLSHLAEGLAYGSQAESQVSGGLDVVEADDRDILGDTEACIAKCTHGSNGGDVVKGE